MLSAESELPREFQKSENAVTQIAPFWVRAFLFMSDVLGIACGVSPDLISPHM
jgi:hypothetical protein